ncbi:MAG TPA: phosphoribosylformylglycinamidine synthase I [Firmicutes bacterium]|nr:phosphoribosylformylglycinamidine synthase I [Bacillota bacterium]
MVKPRAIILRVAGTNCDVETEWAFNLAGGIAERVHINRIIEKEKKLDDYQILAIPGGFSFGDDIAAGKVLANQIKFRLWEEIENFIEKKKPVIGICNGFQVLVKSGILPWNSQQKVTLGWNDSGRFEDRWVYLKIEESRTPFLKGLPEIIKLPVAHAEGKFIPQNKRVLEKLKKNKQIIFRYCNSKGEMAGYPYNPNGSIENIAGICDETGLIIGMMPHPERCLLKYHLPDWLREEYFEEYGYGFKIFKNMVEYFL